MEGIGCFAENEEQGKESSTYRGRREAIKDKPEMVCIASSVRSHQQVQCGIILASRIPVPSAI